MMAQNSGKSTGVGGAQTFLELGWTGPHISMGSGYDVANRTLRPSALEAFSPKPASTALKYLPNIHTVTTSEELKTRIKADVSATVPLEGATVQSTSSYLQSVKTSDTLLVQIIEEIVQEQPVKAALDQLKLSGKASDLLEKDAKEFADKYGEYFVYGHQSRARFSAICTIKCSSKEVRDKVKTSLTATPAKVGEITASLSKSTQTNQESVSIDINLEIDRLKAAKPEEQHVFKTDEILQAYDEFQKDFETVPILALLCHYSAIDSRCPLPQYQFQYLGGHLALAYQNLYIAQSELLTSAMVQAASSSKKISNVCDQIKALDVGKQEAVIEIQNSVRECLVDTENWRLRYDLRGDARKLVNNDFVKDAPGQKVGTWIEAFSTKDWSSGILGAAGNPKYVPLANDVTHQYQQFRVDWKNGYQKTTMTLGQADKIIVGFRIFSYRNDSTNGSFKFHEGGILSSTVTVEFSSQFDRGCDWAFEVWMVSKITYEINESK